MFGYYRLFFQEHRQKKLNSLFQIRQDKDDILIVKNGLLTDTSIANIALYDGNDWYTPLHPLLKGTKRAELLDKGVLKEKNKKGRTVIFFGGKIV